MEGGGSVEGGGSGGGSVRVSERQGKKVAKRRGWRIEGYGSTDLPIYKAKNCKLMVVFTHAPKFFFI